MFASSANAPTALYAARPASIISSLVGLDSVRLCRCISSFTLTWQVTLVNCKWTLSTGYVPSKKDLAQQSVQPRECTSQPLLQIDKKHRRALSCSHPGRFEPPQSLLAVSRCIELRCRSFFHGVPVHLPRATSSRIQDHLRPVSEVGLQCCQLTPVGIQASRLRDVLEIPQESSDTPLSKACGHGTFIYVLATGPNTNKAVTSH
ncbi:hypothetical protein CSKR_100431 [Clonorchis sinensis]|uniref:Uncharacterized protein n=1 Tax=Clonorchis sinensis TaxID=79923 RepID=A0A3R7JX41_CLOSI|nr:hypothetical protein CSKR_100431 [Clonorchis sinensis]